MDRGAWWGHKESRHDWVTQQQQRSSEGKVTLVSRRNRGTGKGHLVQVAEAGVEKVSRREALGGPTPGCVAKGFVQDHGFIASRKLSVSNSSPNLHQSQSSRFRF